MNSTEDILFKPYKLGPITLRNRTIRAAAFEGMCPGNVVSEELLNYHRAVAAGNELAILVKTNTRDGFKGGMELDECIEVARMLEQSGTDALVLSGGFVSKAPMYILRGAMPIKIFAYYIENKLKKKELSRSGCDICNYCIAVIYSRMATCIQNEGKPDPKIMKMLR